MSNKLSDTYDKLQAAPKGEITLEKVEHLILKAIDKSRQPGVVAEQTIGVLAAAMLGVIKVLKDER